MKIKRLYKYFRNSRLGTRFQKYFTVFSIVPILLFSIPLSIYMLSHTLSDIRERAAADLMAMSNEFDALLEDAYNIGNTIGRNSRVYEFLKHNYSSPEKRYRDEIVLNSELVHLLQYSPDNIQVYIFGKNGAVFKNSNHEVTIDLLGDHEWVGISGLDSPKWFLPSNKSLIIESLTEVHLTLALPITRVFKTENPGIIFIDIIVPSQLLKRMEATSSFFIINEDATIFFENERVSEFNSINEIPDLYKNIRSKIKYWKIPTGYYESEVIEDRHDVTAYKASKINNWIYCNTVSKNSAFSSIVTIVFVTISIIFILFSISFLFSYRISKSLTGPIIELTKTMSKVRTGDFSARTEYNSDDEIAVLSRDFNEMVSDITKLMDKIYEEQNKLKQYEFMLLQAQINPHFLYNTLDSIIWLIRMKEVDDSIKMIQALTSFFRTGLSKGKDIINLQQEIENINSYLTIQQLRYKKKLSYEIDFPDEIMTQPLPKLILQPLVENAIYHGIKNIDKDGFIHIYGYQEKKDVIIVVSDNGSGMTLEKMNELNGEIVDIEEGASSSYGFKNVKERLFLFFKDKFSIIVKSKLHEGTTIIIRINGVR